MDWPLSPPPSDGNLAATESFPSDDSSGNEETKTSEIADVDESGPILYNGFNYARYHTSDRTTNYRCSVYKRTKCKAKLFCLADGTVEEKGEHMPGCKPEVGGDDAVLPGHIPNLKAEILEAIDELATSEPTLKPKEVWTRIHAQFYSTPGQIVGALRNFQVEGRYYRTKMKNFENDVFVAIKTEPLCNVRQNPDLKFFNFHVSYFEDENLHHVIGWGHPALLDRLKARKSSLFIDATYKCVPTAFYQLVIVMVHDSISGHYIPCAYVLTTGKTSKVYYHLLHHINASTDFMMDPAYIACDFEQAMMHSVKVQFPRARIIGCLFHFKQALRRKMIKLGIPDREIGIAMLDGAVDWLTAIRVPAILRSGIRGVRQTIREECQDQNIPYSRELWREFWKYFVQTWMKKYDPECWNVYGLEEGIVNRTNNPLERYNRTINRAFEGTHVDTGQFMVVLEREGQQYVDLLANVANHSVRVPRRRRSRVSSTAMPAENMLREEGIDSFNIESDVEASPDY